MVVQLLNGVRCGGVGENGEPLTRRGVSSFPNCVVCSKGKTFSALTVSTSPLSYRTSNVVAVLATAVAGLGRQTRAHAHHIDGRRRGLPEEQSDGTVASGAGVTLVVH